jgi:hypothetical protein
VPVKTTTFPAIEDMFLLSADHILSTNKVEIFYESGNYEGKETQPCAACPMSNCTDVSVSEGRRWNARISGKSSRRAEFRISEITDVSAEYKPKKCENVPN